MPHRLILKVDESVSGPFGGERSAACLRFYTDGTVLYSTWGNSAFSVIDKTGGESRPEHSSSVQYKLDDGDAWELSEFLNSKPVARLREKFDPPHRPIDYFERISVQIDREKGESKSFSVREYYVASLSEKVHYPPALIVLMDKIQEIEDEAQRKGNELLDPPEGCILKPVSTK